MNEEGPCILLCIIFWTAAFGRFDSCADRLRIRTVLSLSCKIHPGCHVRTGMCSLLTYIACYFVCLLVCPEVTVWLAC